MRERTQAGLSAARARRRTGGRTKGLPRKAEATAYGAETLSREGRLSAQGPARGCTDFLDIVKEVQDAVGPFTIVPWHESLTAEQSLRDALEQIALADQLGLDEVWLGEHRFSRHGLLSGFFTFAGHVAARTTRLRIGTAVVVLPLHNPILVAEELAMLDVLSGGRWRWALAAATSARNLRGSALTWRKAVSAFGKPLRLSDRRGRRRS